MSCMALLTAGLTGLGRWMTAGDSNQPGQERIAVDSGLKKPSEFAVGDKSSSEPPMKPQQSQAPEAAIKKNATERHPSNREMLPHTSILPERSAAATVSAQPSAHAPAHSSDHDRPATRAPQDSPLEVTGSIPSVDQPLPTTPAPEDTPSEAAEPLPSADQAQPASPAAAPAPPAEGTGSIPIVDHPLPTNPAREGTPSQDTGPLPSPDQSQPAYRGDGGSNVEAVSERADPQRTPD